MVLRCPYCKVVCLQLEFYEEHQIMHSLQEKAVAQNVSNDEFPFQVENIICKEEAPIAHQESTKVVEGFFTSPEITNDDKVQVINIEDDTPPSAVTDEICLANEVGVSVSTSTADSELKDSLQCTCCEKACRSMSDLLTHLFTHYQSQQCAKCGETFANVGKYNIHMIMHKSIYSSSFICKDCGIHFLKGVALQQHMNTAHKVRKGMFRCYKCKNTLASAFSYQSHLLGHFGKRVHVCHKCCSFFEEEEALQDHLANHTERELMLQCFECGLCFTEKIKLSNHIYLLHNGQEPHQCSICSLIFYEKQKYLLHRCFREQKQT